MTYYFYVLSLLLLLSCSGTSPKNTTQQEASAAPGIQPDGIEYISSIDFRTPEKKQVFSFNETTSIVLEQKDKSTIDSIQLFLNGKELAVLPANVLNFPFQFPAGKVGKNTLKAIAFHPDNKRGVATRTITIKPNAAPQGLDYEMVKTYPHDADAYTQGLVYLDGFMYEGTGQYGKSFLRKTDMSNNNILSALSLDSRLFGEGVTIYKDKIYQITWKSHKGFVYDLETFSLESTFTYNSQGWGITTMGDELIMSDGSNKLYHIDPTTFNVVKEIEVYDHKGPVYNLNELEYINGQVWANVWMTDRIVLIDPKTGTVTADLDMKDLLSASERRKLDSSEEVLNGIAYNPEKGTVYVTGKCWPKLFEIRLKN